MRQIFIMFMAFILVAQMTLGSAFAHDCTMDKEMHGDNAASVAGLAADTMPCHDMGAVPMDDQQGQNETDMCAGTCLCASFHHISQFTVNDSEALAVYPVNQAYMLNSLTEPMAVSNEPPLTPPKLCLLS